MRIFFVHFTQKLLFIVLCYSRFCYLEFSLGEATEHFLRAHQNAFEFLGGVPFKVLIDDPKTAVLNHPIGEKPLFSSSLHRAR